MQPESLIDEYPELQIAMLGNEPEFVTLRETTAFLYDFNLVYELARLATGEPNEDLIFGPHSIYRNGRPLENQARLRVIRLHQESPLDLVTGVAAVGGALTAIWVVLQIFERVYNLPLNRKKLLAEVEKLHRENRIEAEKELAEAERRASELLYASEASKTLQSATKRLARSRIIVKEVSVTIQAFDRRRPNEY